MSDLDTQDAYITHLRNAERAYVAFGDNVLSLSYWLKYPPATLARVARDLLPMPTITR